MGKLYTCNRTSLDILESFNGTSVWWPHFFMYLKAKAILETVVAFEAIICETY